MHSTPVKEVQWHQSDKTACNLFRSALIVIVIMHHLWICSMCGSSCSSFCDYSLFYLDQPHLLHILTSGFRNLVLDYAPARSWLDCSLFYDTSVYRDIRFIFWPRTRSHSFSVGIVSHPRFDEILILFPTSIWCIWLVWKMSNTVYSLEFWLPFSLSSMNCMQSCVVIRLLLHLNPGNVTTKS